MVVDAIDGFKDVGDNTIANEVGAVNTDKEITSKTKDGVDYLDGYKFEVASTAPAGGKDGVVGQCKDCRGESQYQNQSGSTCPSYRMSLHIERPYLLRATDG